MPATAWEQRVARLRLESDALSATEGRTADLLQVQVETRAALAATQAKLDAVDAELEALDGRTSTLRQSVAQLRSQHLRELWMDVIPDDALHSVFQQFVDMPDESWTTFGDGQYNQERAATPFTLATICSRWRKLALSMPGLWTYISVPAYSPFTERPHDELDRISLLLSRSSSLDIDILLRLDDAPTDSLPDVQILMETVTQHVARIRRLELWLPADLPKEPTMDELKGPMPSLTHLCVIVPSSNDWQADSRDTYFPYVPKLQHLELQATGMSCSSTHSSFGSLHSLTLWLGCGLDEFLALAKAALPTLQTIAIAETWANISPGLLPITVPWLSSLAVFEPAPALHLLIVPPKLTQLTLHANAIDTAVFPFLECVAGSVTTLTLSGTITGESLPVLKTLRGVERLVFSAISAYGDYNVSDEFFIQLASTAPDVWPKLRFIHFVQDESDDELVLGEGLLRLVRSRNLPVSEGNPADRPCKLVEVDMGHAGPSWLRSSIAHFLTFSKA